MSRYFSLVSAALLGIVVLLNAPTVSAQQVIHLNVLPPPGGYNIESPIYVVGKNGDPQRLERERTLAPLRQWSRFDYPAQMRRIENAITATQAEIASWQRRVAEYSQYNWGIGKGLFADEENARLNLTKATQRLNDLEADRYLLIRQRNAEQPLREGDTFAPLNSR